MTGQQQARELRLNRSELSPENQSLAGNEEVTGNVQQEVARRIFKAGSTTYFVSSLFFPPAIRQQVFTLYAYVRVADDFVDSIPQKKEGFEAFCAETWLRWDALGSGLQNQDVLDAETIQVVDAFVRLCAETQIERSWVEAFLLSMRADLYKSQYDSLQETVAYMYGSAEVIGLMMCRIFRVDLERAESTARMMGRAMQYINMIRDVAQDEQLGRQYLPREEVAKYGLSFLSKEEALRQPAAFAAFMRSEIGRYCGWMRRARQGFVYLPRELAVPVATAADMYDWTARAIWKNPQLVWNKQLKPDRWQVAVTGISNWMTMR